MATIESVQAYLDAAARVAVERRIFPNTAYRRTSTRELPMRILHETAKVCTSWGEMITPLIDRISRRCRVDPEDVEVWLVPIEALYLGPYDGNWTGFCTEAASLTYDYAEAVLRARQSATGRSANRRGRNQVQNLETTSFNLSASLVKEVTERADAEGKSRSQWVEAALRRALYDV